SREVAKSLVVLDDALQDLQQAGTGRDKESSRRWQASYDCVLARLMMQIAYLYEYQSALGKMRMEFPPRDPTVHDGWRLVARPSLQGDSTGKKMAKEAWKILDKVISDHPGTPWAVLARRDRLTALGLEWQPTRLGLP